MRDPVADPVEVRIATPADAEAMGRVHREIAAPTGRDRPTDPATIMSRDIAPPNGIRRSVGVNGGAVIGFQSLTLAQPGNPYETQPGWGIVGTHISPRAHRRGVGRLPFASTLAAAREVALPALDALIGADNAVALHDDEAMGLRTCRRSDRIDQKCLVLTSDPGDQ